MSFSAAKSESLFVSRRSSALPIVLRSVMGLYEFGSLAFL